ncbi:sugar transferase [Pareuzebyella sediminis]|uniref:sugar transferase n=1 Tax=Pareuzebyella sediminis TaxID=2607998 RepID=UPI0011EDD927|nr:sugar transferase [Pareuzebyella sediminis]
MYRHFFKRFLDFFAALALLIMASPILIFIIPFLAISNRGKVFFIQERPGKEEKIFKIMKFKTMNDKKDADGNLLPDEYRITKVGHLIRQSSLDEIPQLVNVLKGDMSLIGPRPLLISYLPLYSQKQQRRHLIRPGITGWAQVNGRNAISWQQKFDYDVWYVENLSFLVDTKILWLTIKKVIKRDGISSDTSATMEAFTGNETTAG